MDAEAMKKEPLDFIVQLSLKIQAELARSGGELTPELEEELNQVKDALGRKVDGYAAVIERLGPEEEYWRKRAARCEKTAAGIAEFKERLKDRVRAAMLSMQVKRIEGRESRFVLSPGRPMLLFSEKAIPKEYFIRTEDWIADKEKIRADLEAGKEVKGAKLLESLKLLTYPVRGIPRRDNNNAQGGA